MPGGSGPGHRPVPAETPHRQEAHPAPTAAGEGGEHCQPPAFPGPGGILLLVPVH